MESPAPPDLGRDGVERQADPMTGPVVVTRDDDLRADLQRLCAAAAVVPEMITDPTRLRRPWARASCVMVGDDCADEVAAMRLPRRSDAILVTQAPESSDAWRRGIALRADHVCVLPDSEAWIVDLLTETRDRGAGVAAVVGVVGACGGAGASTLAASLAVAAASAGYSVLLVDADPLGGGIELVIGSEDVDGLRWPEVTGADGRVSPAALRSALPNLRGVSVLSARRSTPFDASAESVGPVIDIARRGYDLVVLDLGRRVDPDGLAIVSALDVVLLVATPDVRAAAAAAQLTSALTSACPEVRLVVRSVRGAQLAPADLEASLAIRVAGVVRTRRQLHRSIDDGLGPVLSRRDRRGLLRLLASVLDVRARVSR